MGIIGGMSPETTSKFYLNIIKKSRKHCNSYPSIIIDSVSFPFSLEEAIIQKSENENKILPILKESIKRLNKIGVDFIVIPCNTVHIFIDELKKESDAPIISIIDETIKKIKKRGHKNVGLLATKKTIDSKLYENSMRKNGINVILPTRKEQNDISRTIVEILRNEVTDNSKNAIKKVMKNLMRRGSESIILGCTDLQIILNKDEFDAKLLDSFEILSESTFNKIIRMSKSLKDKVQKQNK